jgi:two-component system, chemotaxis family, protein-glutamate methylesterase/glutaminase
VYGSGQRLLPRGSNHQAVPEDRSWRHFDAGYTACAIAASAGGILAVRELLTGLPGHFPLPVLLAQHHGLHSNAGLINVLRSATPLRVQQASEGELAVAGVVYLAPPGRHLEVRDDGLLSIARAGRVRFVHPSADLLFDSVARFHQERAVAVVLTGNGRDGAEGVSAIRRAGGFVIAQDEDSCHHFDMPAAAIETGKVDLVLSLAQIAPGLCELTGTVQSHLRPPSRRRS